MRLFRLQGERRTLPWHSQACAAPLPTIAASLDLSGKAPARPREMKAEPRHHWTEPGKKSGKGQNLGLDSRLTITTSKWPVAEWGRLNPRSAGFLALLVSMFLDGGM
jgi:hypothetical protein